MKVFDLHCDTLSELRRAEMRGDGQTFAHNNGHIDLELSLIHISEPRDTERSRMPSSA